MLRTAGNVRPGFTALAVTVFALLIIWLVAPRWPAAAWSLGTVAAILLVRHSRSVADVGLGWRNLRSALKAWWWAYLLCLLVLATLVERHPVTRGAMVSGVAYFAECVVQQLIYQHLVCAPLTAELGNTSKSQWASGLLFSVVHLPNPVLMPATLVWGVVASMLFRERRSLWAVALFQYLLSGILYALVPYGWHHAFRIGPRYFRG